MSKEVVVLPGDGIGPEVIAPTIDILKAVTDELEFEEYPFGGASIEQYGTPLTDETFEACQQSDAILFGAAGGMQWGNKSLHGSATPEKGLLSLRKELGLYANLRLISDHAALRERSPLKEGIVRGAELLVVRELSGGIYYGEKSLTDDEATDVCRYTRGQIERIAHFAFQVAEHKVTNIDKANVLATSKLWRRVVSEVSEEYDDVALEHLLVDNAALQIPSWPRNHEVILAENMFGDIISDELGLLHGSLGVMPSASLGEEGQPGLFEPVHGSAPDIAGRGVANPLACFLSAAMMLYHGLGMEDEALAVEDAVEQALIDGLRTYDLGGRATTEHAKSAVLKHL